MNTNYREAPPIHNFISPMSDGYITVLFASEETESQKVDKTCLESWSSKQCQIQTQLCLNVGSLLNFFLRTLAQPLLGSHKSGHCSCKGALRWPGRCYLGQPGIWQTKSEHPSFSVAVPLWVNPNLLTLHALILDCSLCRMSQLSPSDLGLYSWL